MLEGVWIGLLGCVRVLIVCVEGGCWMYLVNKARPGCMKPCSVDS